MTLISDPKILEIPIIENGESLVDLRHQTTIMIGPSPEIENNRDYTKLRKTVFHKLLEAHSLLPSGLNLCLYEGYRSLSLQKELFNNRFSKVQKLHPEWSEDQIFNETTKLVAPVINKDGSKNIPPHSTGAAVDVYLVDDKGIAIDMGIHPKDWMQDHEGCLSKTISQKISSKSQYYRDIMSQVLEAVDFVNYPFEYWHWSYGDRYWAYKKDKENSIYSSL